MTHPNQPPPDSVLDTVRDEIREVDRDLARLLMRRQTLAKKIAQCKIDRGIPLRNYTVEKKVIGRMAAECAADGGKPQWGINLARFLIEHSLEAQSNLLERRRSGGIQKVLVIGGLGKMGQWMCGFLSNQGHEVTVLDHAGCSPDFPNAANLAEGVECADMIVVSTPLSRTHDVMQSVIELQPKGVVLDLASLKKDLLPVYRTARDRGVSITGLHPLFGPGTTTLHGRNVVITSCGDRAADRAAHALFAETSAQILVMEPVEHDRLMTLTLGMSHALNLLFGRVLAHCGEDFQNLHAVASSTYEKQLGTALDVILENMDLYFEIQRQCDFDQIYESMFTELSAIKSMVSQNQLQDFETSMSGVSIFFRAALQPHPEPAD